MNYFGHGTPFELVAAQKKHPVGHVNCSKQHTASLLCRWMVSAALSEIPDLLKVRHLSDCLAVLTLTRTLFFPRTVADWNSLSDFARSRSSVDAFRDALSSDLAQPPGCC